MIFFYTHSLFSLSLSFSHLFLFFLPGLSDLNNSSTQNLSLSSSFLPSLFFVLLSTSSKQRRDGSDGCCCCCCCCEVKCERRFAVFRWNLKVTEERERERDEKASYST